MTEQLKPGADATMTPLEVCQAISEQGWFGKGNTPEELVEILDEHKTWCDSALAAYEQAKPDPLAWQRGSSMSEELKLDYKELQKILKKSAGEKYVEYIGLPIVDSIGEVITALEAENARLREALEHDRAFPAVMVERG